MAPEKPGARPSLEGSEPSHQAAETHGATLGHHLGLTNHGCVD